MRWKVNIRRLVISFLFITLLFIMCLESISDIVVLQKCLKHLDEMLMIILTAYIVINFRTITRKKTKVIGLWAILLSFGLISSLIYRYQPIIPVLIDAFLLTDRFIIGYLSAFIFCRKRDIKVSDEIMPLAKIATLVLFLLAMHDIIFPPLFPTADYRYFMYGLQLFFPHATYLAAAAITLLIFFGYRNTVGDTIIYMLMTSFLAVSTVRSKAIGFVVIYWLVYFAVFILKAKLKYFYVLLPIGGAAALVFGWRNIVDNFYNASIYSPRSIMFRDSCQLMIKHFPLGTGFGTYGSSIAINYYSPLYEALGYQNNLGMSSDNSAFLTDCFWPTVFSEFGLFGTVCFLGIIVYLLNISIKKIRDNRHAGFAMLMTLAYLLIASLAESSFFNPTAFLLMMMFAVYELER